MSDESASTNSLGHSSSRTNPDAQPGANGTRRYLAGKRLVFGGGPWSFTVSEALKTTRLPDPEWALVLPLFFYQNDATAHVKRHYFPFLITNQEPNTYFKNYSGDVGASYTADRHSGLNFYGDLLIDDVKALPGLGNGFDTPQKAGRADRRRRAALWAARTAALARVRRVQWRSTGGRTRTFPHPFIWTLNGAPLGYAAGPNARVLFARLDATITDKLKIAIDGETRRPKGNAASRLHVDQQRPRGRLRDLRASRATPSPACASSADGWMIST